MKRLTKPIDLTPESLAELRFRYRPAGSGPLGVMRKVVQLVEQIAENRGIDLDEVEWTYTSRKFDGTPGPDNGRKFKGLHPVGQEK